jgi:hypothetical protein
MRRVVAGLVNVCCSGVHLLPTYIQTWEQLRRITSSKSMSWRTNSRHAGAACNPGVTAGQLPPTPPTVGHTQPGSAAAVLLVMVCPMSALCCEAYSENRGVVSRLCTFNG